MNVDALKVLSSFTVFISMTNVIALPILAGLCARAVAVKLTSFCNTASLFPVTDFSLITFIIILTIICTCLHFILQAFYFFSFLYTFLSSTFGTVVTNATNTFCYVIFARDAIQAAYTE